MYLEHMGASKTLPQELASRALCILKRKRKRWSIGTVAPAVAENVHEHVGEEVPDENLIGQNVPEIMIGEAPIHSLL